MTAPTALRDLTAGTRIRHTSWETTGTVKVSGGRVSVRWHGILGEDEISADGPVFPGDIEIIAVAP